MNNNNKFYLTTPLYYVNAEPHIGTAYTTIISDCIARFWRLYGSEVSFLTGVDEHGGKIEKTAQENNISPQEHCDITTEKFKDLWSKLNIEYNHFARPSSEHHKKFVQTFFNKVLEKGDIYKGSYTGKYCLGCEDFKTEKELEEGNLCPIHKTPVQDYSEENYFFRLSSYTDKVKKILEDNAELIKPAYRIHEIKAWLDEGLRDFPISRGSVKWGIPIPNDNSQTIYVWFDALLGYLSQLVNNPESLDELKDFDGYTHIIGKDILRFHTVYWLSMLMSAELPLPKQLFGHGFLTKDGLKMGKSLGNIVDPHQLINDFGVDATRFYFIFQIAFGSDGDYSENSFIELANSYLANRLGNLCSRVLKMYTKNMNSTVPTITLNSESKILTATRELPEKVKTHFEKLEPHLALQKIFDVIDIINLELSDIRPWTLFKSESQEDINTAQVLILETLESIRIIANLLSPFMPDLALKILEIYNISEIQNWESLKNINYLQTYNTVNAIPPLFSRIQKEE